MSSYPGLGTLVIGQCVVCALHGRKSHHESWPARVVRTTATQVTVERLKLDTVRESVDADSFVGEYTVAHGLEGNGSRMVFRWSATHAWYQTPSLQDEGPWHIARMYTEKETFSTRVYNNSH